MVVQPVSDLDRQIFTVRIQKCQRPPLHPHFFMKHFQDFSHALFDRKRRHHLPCYFIEDTEFEDFPLKTAWRF